MYENPTTSVASDISGGHTKLFSSVNFHLYAYECWRPETQAQCEEGTHFAAFPKFMLDERRPANPNHVKTCD